MTAQAKALDTVSHMILRALLDPDTPESHSAIRLASKKLKSANVDPHSLTIGLPYPSISGWGFDQYQRELDGVRTKLNTAEIAKGKAEAKLLVANLEVKSLKGQFTAKAIELEKASDEIERLKAQLEQAAKPRTPRTLTTTKWVTRLSYTVAQAIQAKADIDLAHHRGDIPDAMAAAKMKSHVTRRTVVAMKRTR